MPTPTPALDGEAYLLVLPTLRHTVLRREARACPRCLDPGPLLVHGPPGPDRHRFCSACLTRQAPERDYPCLFGDESATLVRAALRGLFLHICACPDRQDPTTGVWLPCLHDTRRWSREPVPARSRHLPAAHLVA